MRHSPLSRRRGRAFAWLLAGLLLGGALGAGAMYIYKRGKAGVEGGPRLGRADELAMIPPDSVGFVHIRAREIWKSDYLDQFRQVMDKAGPDALAILNDSFVPSPSTLDRMTVVVLKVNDGKGGPPKAQFPREGNSILPGGLNIPFDVPSEASGAVVLLAFTKPFEAGRIRSTYMPNGIQKTDSANGKEYWLDKAVDHSRDLGLYFPSDTVMVVGPATGVELFVSKQTKDGKQPDGPLTASLKIAAEGGRHMIAGLNIKALGKPGEKLFENAPNEMKAVETDLRTVMKADAIALGLAFSDKGARIDIRAAYGSDADARSAEAAARSVAAHLRTQLDKPKKELKAMLEGKPGQSKPRPIRDLPEAVLGLFGTGALNMVDDNLANPPIKVEGNELVATFEGGTIGGAYAGAAAVGVGLLMPAVQKVREAAGRMQDSNNLKQIGLGMHNYADTNGGKMVSPGTLTPPKNAPMNSGPGLSWRVNILPYIDEVALYKEFKLDEPWDSPNNKKLIDRMPKIYASPLAPAPAGQTYYKVFVGGGAAFDLAQQIRFPASFSDGTSNTIMAIEGGAPVIWTKPEDIPFDGKNVAPMSFSMPGRSQINVLMADGSVRNIDLSRITPETFKAAITRAGGEILGADWDGGPGIPFPNGKGDNAPIPFPKGKAPFPKGKGPNLKG